MTLEHPPVMRRKDFGAPEPLPLETELRRKTVRGRLYAMLTTFAAVSAIEGLAVSLVAGQMWLVAVFGGLGLLYGAAARRFGGAWIRRALGAEVARNPRLNRLTRALASSSGLGRVDALLVRADGTNGFAIGPPHPAVVATTGSLNVDDLVLEGLVAHEVVRIRDGDAALACAYAAIAGAPSLVRRNLASPGGWLLAIGLALFPAAIAVRAARRLWFDADELHRADIAAALLTRYPPGIETALSKIGRPPDTVPVAEPLWFSTDAERRAGLLGEM